MPDKSNNRFQFWKELKRRKVFKVVAMYAAAAYVIIELTNNIAEPLGLPSWTPTMIIVLLIIGFPFAVIFSWIFDITPEGIKKTENIDQKIPKSTQKRGHLNKVIIASLSIAVILLTRRWCLPPENSVVSHVSTILRRIVVPSRSPERHSTFASL